MNCSTPRKIKIVQILPGGEIGGAERSVQWLAEFADRSRFDYFFIFLYYGGPIEKEIAARGFPTRILKWENGYSLIGRFRLIKLLLSFKPDIIHDHIQTPLTRILLKLFTGAPIIATQHGNALIPKLSIRWLFLFLDNLVTSLVIANSSFTAQKFSQLYHCPLSKLAIVYLGINADKYKEKSGSVLPVAGEVNPIRIVFIGRLEEFKGVFHLPRLAKELIERGEKIVINVVGDGPARKACEDLVHENGLDHCINFLGWEADVRNILVNSDLLVFLSLVEEGFGLVLLEAIASGLPVFAYAGGGVGEILKNAPSAWSVPKGDFQQMAKLIAMNKEVIRKPEKLAGYQYVKDNFDISKTVQKLESIYQLFGEKRSK